MKVKLQVLKYYTNTLRSLTSKLEMEENWNNILYRPCKEKKEELLKRIQQTDEKNQIILSKFEDGIENVLENFNQRAKKNDFLFQLKKIELHEALKNEKQKYLIDIYYNQDEMKKWRNNCIESHITIKSKIDKSSQLIKTIKEKLKDEKDKNARLVKAQFQNKSLNADSLVQDSETMQGFVKKCYESKHYKGKIHLKREQFTNL